MGKNAHETLRNMGKEGEHPSRGVSKGRSGPGRPSGPRQHKPNLGSLILWIQLSVKSTHLWLIAGLLTRSRRHRDVLDGWPGEGWVE